MFHFQLNPFETGVSVSVWAKLLLVFASIVIVWTHDHFFYHYSG
jgi:hypothetical protein